MHEWAKKQWDQTTVCCRSTLPNNLMCFICYIVYTENLAQLAECRAWYSKCPGFIPDHAPNHITCLFSPPLAICNEAMTFFFSRNADSPKRAGLGSWRKTGSREGCFSSYLYFETWNEVFRFSIRFFDILNRFYEFQRAFSLQEIALPETKWYKDESELHLDMLSKNNEVWVLIEFCADICFPNHWCIPCYR